MRDLAFRAARRVPMALSMAASTGGTKPANQLQCTLALTKNIVGTGVLTVCAYKKTVL